MDIEITKRINGLLAEGFEVDEAQMTPDAVLKTTLDLDSLDYIDLTALTEANFGCKITPDEFNAIVTFQNLYDYISVHAKQ
jgi:acyl carrier protein